MNLKPFRNGVKAHQPGVSKINHQLINLINFKQ